MTIRPDTYLGHLIAGRDPGEIDDWVDRWHSGNSTMSLAAFLGMTDEEYGNWALAPAALEHIAATRRMVEEARMDLTHAIATMTGDLH